MMDIMEGGDSLQAVRSTFEKAIIATGLHVTEVCWLNVTGEGATNLGFYNSAVLYN